MFSKASNRKSSFFSFKDVAVLLKVDSIDSIIPEVITLQLESQRIDNIQQVQ